MVDSNSTNLMLMLASNSGPWLVTDILNTCASYRDTVEKAIILIP